MTKVDKVGLRFIRVRVSGRVRFIRVVGITMVPHTSCKVYMKYVYAFVGKLISHLEKKMGAEVGVRDKMFKLPAFFS